MQVDVDSSRIILGELLFGEDEGECSFSFLSIKVFISKERKHPPLQDPVPDDFGQL